MRERFARFEVGNGTLTQTGDDWYLTKEVNCDSIHLVENKCFLGGSVPFWERVFAL